MKKMVLVLMLIAGIMVSGFAAEVPEWFSVVDAADGGTSTAEVVVADEKIDGKDYKGVTTVSGKVTTDFQYGYAGMQMIGDNPTGVEAAFLDALKKGSGIKLVVSGDGKTYDFRVNTNDRPDYCYHMFSVKTTKGKVTTYEIPYKKLKQYTWGAKKSFKKENISGLSFQTSSYPLASYELKVISVEVMP